jgi:TrmH RNA methyltransferase
MFHGLRACEALFARRPEAIVRVYLAEPRRRQLQPLVDWCVKHRKGFQIVGDENLHKLTGSIHHEGVAILAKSVRLWSLDDLLREFDTRRLTGPVLYLDGVQNPHNLGSILRTAAHFGVAALLGRVGELPAVSPAAVRVAEGGAEFVPICELADPVADLQRLRKAGYRIVASSSHRGQPLARSLFGDRSVIVLGGEGEGVSRLVESLADACVQIPGTAAVESLNVAVACGVILAVATARGSS